MIKRNRLICVNRKYRIFVLSRNDEIRIFVNLIRKSGKPSGLCALNVTSIVYTSIFLLTGAQLLIINPFISYFWYND